MTVVSPSFHARLRIVGHVLFIDAYLLNILKASCKKQVLVDSHRLIYLGSFVHVGVSSVALMKSAECFSSPDVQV